MTSGFDDTLTNLSRPRTSAIITVRVIKSFEFRTERSLVLRDINLETTTVGHLKGIARNGQPNETTQPGWKPYRSALFGLPFLSATHGRHRFLPCFSLPRLAFLDTLKLYTQAHGAKTTNLIINLDHDEWILSDEGKTLSECGLENETEVSFFNRELYENFKLNPQTRWEC